MRRLLGDLNRRWLDHQRVGIFYPFHRRAFSFEHFGDVPAPDIYGVFSSRKQRVAAAGGFKTKVLLRQRLKIFPAFSLAEALQDPSGPSDLIVLGRHLALVARMDQIAPILRSLVGGNHLGVVHDGHRIVVKRRPKTVLIFKRRREAFALLGYVRSGDALLDQNLGVKGAAEIEHVDQIFFGAILRQQTLHHFVSVVLIRLYFQKLVFHLEHPPHRLRRGGAQRDVSFDLAASLLRRLDYFDIRRHAVCTNDERKAKDHKCYRSKFTFSVRHSISFPSSTILTALTF